MPTPASRDEVCQDLRGARALAPTAPLVGPPRRPRTYTWWPARAVALRLALLGAGAIGACDSKTNRADAGPAGDGSVFVPPTGTGGRPGGATPDGGVPRPTEVNEQGTTVAKFCNNLVGTNRMNLQFTVELGSQPVRLVANSGQCAPARGQPCVTIPAGAIKLRVLLDGMATPVLDSIAPVTAGAPTIIAADTDEQMRGVITIATLDPAARCEDVDLGSADAGAP